MAKEDSSQLKPKILSILTQRGPCLPIHIAQRTGLNTLFASAFLSELISERKVKVSHMKVGNSPLYFLPGQENMIENFSDHLKKKEKDAFLLLRKQGFLEDSQQHPAIRVALRSIRDFAIPFKDKEGNIIWRYLTIEESQYSPSRKQKEKQVIKPLSLQEEIPSTQEDLDIFEEIKEKIPQKKESKSRKKATIKGKKTTASQKKNEKFFNKVKTHLKENSIEILDIESFNKNDLVLRIEEENEEKLLIAYNKKRITELDIIKASKKATEADLSYIILSLGEPLKKLTNMIEAIQNLSSIEKI